MPKFTDLSSRYFKMLPARQKIFIVFVLAILLGILYYSKKGNNGVNQALLQKIFSMQNQPKETIDTTLTKICGEGNFLQGPPAQDDPRILAALRERHLIPPSKLPYNFTKESQEHNKRYYPASNISSFHFIDYYVKLFLGDQKKGFFLDSGALDGDIFSNSLWLEKQLGWTGILIEVDPNSFQHLIWKRRKTWAANTCISRGPYPMQPVFEFLQAKGAHGLPWIYGANSRSMDSPFSKLKDGWTLSANITRVRTQCFPLASYLLALNVTTLDFLTLDIQGYEWEVLQTLPFDKVKIRVMAIEYYFLSEENKLHLGVIDPGFVKFMKQSGYHMVDFDPESNYIFVLKNDTIYENKIKGKTIDKYYVRMKRIMDAKKTTKKPK